MERFLLDNAARHQMLLQRFKPPRQKTESNPEATTSNITVGTRIRPMFKEELLSGQVAAVFPRVDSSGVVDLHELRRVVRGFPPLNVSTNSLADIV
jgi:kinesin family protein 2/24